MKMRWIDYLAPLMLIEWGLVFIYFYLSGRVRSYLIPNLQPLVVVAGIVMGLLAIIMLLSLRWDEEDEDDHAGHDHVHGPDCGHDHSHDHKHGPDCGHDHDHHHEHEHEVSAAACCGQPGHEGHTHGPSTASGAIFRTLLLTVPLLVAAVVSHDQFGQTLVRNRGASMTFNPSPAMSARMQAEAVQNSLPKPENDLALPGEKAPPPSANSTADAATPSFTDDAGPLPAEVTDLVVASQKDFMRKVFEGKPVNMVGQVYEEDPKKVTPGSFGLVRFVMTCCAADAQPVVVPVHIDAKQGRFPDMTWVKIIGTVHYKKTDKGFEPVVDSATVTETPEPEDPYLN